METNFEQIKEDLKRDLLEKQENKILEESNVKLLCKLIDNADNVQEAIAIAELGTTYKRTGFHFDKRLEHSDNTIRYLVKNEQLSFETDKNSLTHKLIIGDNYPALLNLLITHKEAIDVIYIDPPYGADSMGEFAETNYTNSLTRDNLLSMLYPRLLLAKQLLSEDGVIFVSIDDKNMAYIKCLLDELFGEQNFVACAPRKTVSSITTKSNHELQKLNDYILIYVKSDRSCFSQVISGQATYPFEDERGKYRLVPLQDFGPHGTKTARPNLYYPIYLTSNGDLVLEPTTKTDKMFLPKKHKGDDGSWMWSKKKFIDDNQDLTVSDKDIVSIKHYYKEGEDTNKYQAHKTWLDKYPNKDGSLMLNSIFCNNTTAHIFGYPKPVELIKWCISLHPNPNAIVLDFFAGSGTTGQAVLDLNREDNGNRAFILCTNNEITDVNPNGIAVDVTSERLRRIMTGKTSAGMSDFDWLKKNEPYGDNLEVLDIETVANNEMTPGKTPFDVIDETLYGLPKFETLNKKIVWVCQNFDRTQRYLEDEKE